MSIDDKAEELDEDHPLHPDQLPGPVVKNLYEGPEVGGEKEHEAMIDIVYEKNKQEYGKEEYRKD